ARRLRRLGVLRGSVVALCVERSAEMVAVLLGILRAGAAYLPLDACCAPVRARLMLEDARPTLVITQRSLERRVAHPEWPIAMASDVVDDARRECAAPLESHVTADDLAYVIFTSGSTGRPKGVAIPHGALANFLLSMAAE